MAVKKHLVQGKDKDGEMAYRVFWDGRAVIIQDLDHNFKWTDRMTICPDKNCPANTEYIVKEWTVNPYNRHFRRVSENCYRHLYQVHNRLIDIAGIKIPEEIKDHLEAYETMQFMASVK